MKFSDVSDVENIVSAIELDSGLKSLAIEASHLYPAQIKMVCETLATNETPLEELAITDTEVGRAAEEVGMMLQLTPSLKRMVLDNCRLSSIGARLLANYVEGHEGLEELVVDNNEIGDAAMVDLMLALSGCAKPVHFVVYQNPVSERVQTVAEALNLNVKWGAYRPENIHVCG